jgi:hypothetical protein
MKIEARRRKEKRRGEKECKYARRGEALVEGMLVR